MKKTILSTLLLTLLFSFVSSTSSACDKVLKNPKSSKNTTHIKK
jgi:hypothetical protein